MLKQTRLLAFGAATIALAVFAFTACKKSSSSSPSSSSSGDTSYSSQSATAEKSYNDAGTIADNAVQNVANGSGINYRTMGTGTHAAHITHSGDSIIIDFGPHDTLCGDGVYRRGKIIVTFSGHSVHHLLDSAGAYRQITFDSFYQADNQILGTHLIKCLGSVSGHIEDSIIVNGSIVLADGSGTIGWVSNRLRTWEVLATSSTAAFFDSSVVTVSAQSTLTKPSGAVYVISTKYPLKQAMNCWWVESGTLKYSLPGGDSALVNYDYPNNYPNGACDREAQLTYNGHTYNFVIK
jgi:hypothetical protein